MLQSSKTPHSFIAKTLYGLEGLLASELQALGATEIVPHNRAVSFSGSKTLLYQANLHCRTANRILYPIYEFSAHNEEQLYQGVRGLDWSQFLGVEDTLAVDSILNSPFFNHSQFVSQKVKDAIVDQFRDNTGNRPSVNLQQPDFRIHLHVLKDRCSLSLDSSGASLYQRGYKLAQNEAPLNEVLAAGMIMLTGWTGENNFFDPMCGSGTLLTEAALIAKNRAPGIARKHFGFMKWKDFDKELWEDIQQQAVAAERGVKAVISGSDANKKTIDLARENVRRAGLENDIILFPKDFRDAEPPAGGGVAIFNPPYGMRMETDTEILGFYKMIGDTLKKRYAGYHAWIVSANKEAMKNIGLKPSRRLVLFNGPLECKYHKFEMYEGSKKGKYMSEQGEKKAKD